MISAQIKIATASVAASTTGGAFAQFLGAHANADWRFWLAVTIVTLVFVPMGGLASLSVLETQVAADEVRKKRRQLILSLGALFGIGFAVVLGTQADLPRAIFYSLGVGMAGGPVLVGILTEKVQDVLRALFGGSK